MSADKDPSAAPEPDKDKITLRPFPEPPKPAPEAEKPTPAKQTLSPEQFAAEVFRLDRVLIGAVLLVAFVLATFPVRNSDFWMHLATGRALVQGQYSLGTDPFAHTTAGVYWANHSWLYDLLLYGFTRLIGGIELASTGIVLVVLKALAVTLLAWVMLALRRRGRSAWVPVACVTLSLVVMSPRLLFQPMLVSLLFLGLTIYFLAREGKPDRKPGMKWRQAIFTTSPERLYVLPALFLLWVNLDQWFLLGPFTVALYLVGDFLQKHIAPVRTEDDTPDPREQRTLAAVLGLGLVACLISPHHYRAYVLPPELFPGVDLAALRGDHDFDALFTSPLESRYREADLGYSVAGSTYYLLVVLGLGSFLLNAAGTRGWRTVTWLVFCLLGASNMRLIPFFAVVAGPITALNLQDYVGQRFGTELPDTSRGRRWALAGRALTLLGLIGLMVATWPGWLQVHAGHPRLARHGGWGVEVKPSLRKAGEQLRAWRQQGRLGDNSRGFNDDMEIANYCAWFCPEEKGFFDTRYALFAGVMKDYVAMRRSLRDEDPPEVRRGGKPAWQRIVRERQVDHFLFDHTRKSSDKLTRSLHEMLQLPKVWTLIYMDGQTTIVGKRDPDRPGVDPFAPLAINLQDRAFGPEADRAPANGPARAPRALSGWDTFWQASPPRPLESDEAIMDLLYFQAVSQRDQWEHQKVWVAAIEASLAGGGASGGPTVLSQPGQLMVGDLLFPRYLAAKNYGAAGAPVVALRAARRAVAANPDEAACYLSLGDAVAALWRRQEDYWSNTPPPPRINHAHLVLIRDLLNSKSPAIGRVLSPWVTNAATPRELLRQVQLVTALEHSLLIQPHNLQVHRSLADIYWQMGYYDLSIDHFRELVKQNTALGPVAPETKEEFDKRVARNEKAVERLDNELKQLRTDYEVSSANLPPLTRAARALAPYGLAKHSITLLEQADPAKFTPDQAELLVYLLLTTGQVEKLKGDPAEKYGVVSPNLKSVLARYHYYQGLLAAAVGDHDQAGKSIEEYLKGYQPPPRSPLLQLLEGLTFGRLMQHPLGQLVQAPILQAHAVRGDMELRRQQEAAEFQLLRGLIALDEGDNETARRYFALAMKTGEWTYPFEGRAIAERYLELLQGKK